MVGDGVGFSVGDSVSGCSVAFFDGISVGFSVADLVGALDGPLVVVVAGAVVAGPAAALDGPDEGGWVVVAVTASNQSSKLKNLVGDTEGAGLVGVASSNQSLKLKNLVGDTEGTGLVRVAALNKSSKLKTCCRRYRGNRPIVGLSSSRDHDI